MSEEVNKTTKVNKNVKKQILNDDDEFEDFPVDSWPNNETINETNLINNLWVENWDDIDVEDDFINKLKQELNNK